MGTPWVVITSGDDTALYSSLLNATDLPETEPLHRFGFHDLVGDNGESILRELASLIGKQPFAAGHEELTSRVDERLMNGGLDQAWRDFKEQASDFEVEIKTTRLSVQEFLSLAEQHSETVRQSVRLLHEGMIDLASLDHRIWICRRSKSIGLEYRLKSQPRIRILGLVGVYPESAHISFGLEHWKEAGLPERLYRQLKRYPRQVGSQEWAEDLLALLREAILTITQVPHADTL